MTKEEAKQIFLNRGFVEVDGGNIFDGDKWRESCRVISEWLEQEPCEDAVSRAEVLNLVRYNAFHVKSQMKAIENMPSVTPARKTGKWVKHDTGHSIYYDCSLCSCVAPCTETADKILWKLSNYCPNCGAEMESEE